MAQASYQSTITATMKIVWIVHLLVSNGMKKKSEKSNDFHRDEGIVILL